MMDLRYHVASLMGVFLALTVGIVVGVSLGSSERQAATIQHLQQDVAAIRSEDSHIKEVNAELRRELTAREEAEKLLLPPVVHGHLAGRRVALILVGDAAEAWKTPVSDALSQAGAELLVIHLPRADSSNSESESSSPVTSDPPREQMPASQRRSARRSAVSSEASPSTTDPGGASAVDIAAGELTRALLDGRPALLEEARARLKELELSDELRAPIRRLLLLCPNEQPDYASRIAAGSGVEAAVARVVQSEGATLVAAEPEARAESGDLSLHDSASLMPALATLGAATVDNIDTAVGQIAAVFALAGARGSFGTGAHATRPLPPLEELMGAAPSPAPAANHASR